ncbi:MAG TPA: response regulator [Rhizomicrobium sp.]|jgi:two-component system response regulator FixJ|nr:response regulator [Rhizomicrobium sp.]
MSDKVGNGTGKQSGTTNGLVYVVDDDEAVRESVCSLLQAVGYRTEAFSSASEFLSHSLITGACLISDIRMPGMDGLELQEELNRRHWQIPVIIITGHGDVGLAVRAMKAGAIDFIEKPFEAETLFESVARGLDLASRTKDQAAAQRAAKQMVALLTPRERSVLEQLVAGRSNKIAAYELGISPRTVEIHRAHIMDKMNARSLSDLVRIALAAGQAGNA